MKFKYRHIFYGIAGLLLAALLIVLLPIDDELEPEAVSWRQSANDTRDVKDNGYYYLMGITAPQSEDPEAAGKALVEAYWQAEQEFLNGGLEEFPSFDTGSPEKELPLPSGDYYCRIQDTGCFDRLANADLDTELRAHAVLLERYLRYSRFEIIKPLVKPSIYEQLPVYSYVLRGHKLNQFRILLENASGNRERALTLLLDDITRLRQHLAGARTLISKMVVLNMLVDDLDLVLNVADSGSWRYAIPPLTGQERSLYLPMMREFGLAANLLLEHPDGFSANEYGPGNWVINATIKPNMTLNGLLPNYDSVYRLSLVPASEFSRTATEGDQIRQAGFNLRNIGGSILNSIAVPEFSRFIARIHDVDCKIVLVNAVLPLDEPALSEVMSGDRVLEAVNPYNPSERPHIDTATHALCFNGPFPDEAKRRCIRKDRVL